MIESEAKKRWCPFADSGYMWTGVFGDVKKDDISPRCLGSSCMAWVKTENNIIDTAEYVTDVTNNYRTLDEFLEDKRLLDYEYLSKKDGVSTFVKRTDEECGYCQRLQ